MSDLVIPHAIVFNACLKYCEDRFKELSQELHIANQRSDDISDPISAVYTHQIAELVSKKEIFRRLFHTLLSDGRVRIIIDYGDITPMTVNNREVKPPHSIQFLTGGESNEKKV